MKNSSDSMRLLLVGALPRIGVAAIMIALLWLAFFWATATPGAF